jgi:hypothetical protein
MGSPYRGERALACRFEFVADVPRGQRRAPLSLINVHASRKEIQAVGENTNSA